MLDVFDHPFDRIKGVATLVELRSLFPFDVRSHVDECTFRHVTTANILEGKDIATLFKLHRWPECSLVKINPIRADRIGSPQQKNGITSIRFGIVRNVYRREQFCTITHRDLQFILGVVHPNVVGTLVRAHPVGTELKCK